jgi:hypothetical protein
VRRSAFSGSAHGGEVNREVVGFRRIQRWEASRKVGRLQDPVAGGGES